MDDPYSAARPILAKSDRPIAGVSWQSSRHLRPASGIHRIHESVGQNPVSAIDLGKDGSKSLHLMDLVPAGIVAQYP